MKFGRGALITTLLVTGGLSLACGGADVTGTLLSIDGEAWSVATCESGAVYGFSGIQLEGEDGRRVRVETLPDGTANVYLLEAGAPTGTALGACATAAFERTGLTINDVVALRGAGDVKCEGPVKIEGPIVVDKCATPLMR